MDGEPDFDPEPVSPSDPLPISPPAGRAAAESVRLRRRLEALELSRLIALVGAVVTVLAAIGLGVRELLVLGSSGTAWAVVLMGVATCGGVIGLYRWQLWPRALFLLGALAGVTVFVTHLASAAWLDRRTMLGYAAVALTLANLWSFPVWASREYRRLSATHGDVDAALAEQGPLGRAVDSEPPGSRS